MARSAAHPEPPGGRPGPDRVPRAARPDLFAGRAPCRTGRNSSPSSPPPRRRCRRRGGGAHLEPPGARPGLFAIAVGAHPGPSGARPAPDRARRPCPVRARPELFAVVAAAASPPPPPPPRRAPGAARGRPAGPLRHRRRRAPWAVRGPVGAGPGPPAVPREEPAGTLQVRRRRRRRVAAAARAGPRPARGAPGPLRGGSGGGAHLELPGARQGLFTITVGAHPELLRAPGARGM